MSSFTLITLDTGLLGSYYSAQSQLRTLGAGSASPPPVTAGSAEAAAARRDMTPWAVEDDSESLLVSRYNKIRNQSSFLDLKDEAVKKAGNDVDSKALFALYLALDKLKTVAEYAADGNTLEAQLGKLSRQFNGGMKEVLAYLEEVELDKLTLLAGRKKASYDSGIALGKDRFEYLGKAISVASDEQPLTGLAGNESFTLNVSEFLDSDDIQINLNEIQGDITLKSLAAHINARIGAVQTLNSQGEPVRKYSTRVTVEKLGEDRYALKLSGGGRAEKLSFSAPAAEPALYITGTTRQSGEDLQQAMLSKLKDVLSPASSREFSQTVAAVDESLPLPELKDEDGNAIEAEQEYLHTTSAGTAVDSQGNVYVLGATRGDFGTQRNAAEDADVYLNKFDSNGQLLWSRLVGATGMAAAYDIAVDAEDNVVIAGETDSKLMAGDALDGTDSFVRKYSLQGDVLWTRQLDSVARDQASGLALDANGDVYVTGGITGRLNSGTVSGGGLDAYVVRLSGADGGISQSTQFGGAGAESGKAIAIADDGSILVASEEDGQAVIRKLDAADLSTELARHTLGDLGYGAVEKLVVADGAIYVAGTVDSAGLAQGGQVAQGGQGGRDGFVTRLVDAGAALAPDWTSYLGSASSDSIADMVVRDGAVYVAGTTFGTLAGQQKFGVTDGFAARLDGVTGGVDWQHQLGGTTGFSGSSGIAFSQAGSSVLSTLGLPTGLIERRETRDIETQTTARPGDHFFVSINDRAPVKVSLRAGESYDDLAKRIDRLSFRFIEARETLGSEGPRLSIKARNGAEIKVTAGKGGQDMLAKLGMKPATILPEEELFNIGDDTEGTDPDNLGGVFALDLEHLLVLRNKQEAEYVAGQLDQVMANITRAYRSLTYDPVRADILRQSKQAGPKPSGPPPPHLTRQLANYQAGLNRLLAGGGASGGSVLI